MVSLRSLDRWGHIGYVFVILGMILLTQQSTYGWALRMVGELIWVVVGIKLRMSSVWSWGIVFVLLDLYGIYSWYHNPPS